MRKILTVLAFTAVFSTFAFAANWSGTLLDAACYDTQQQQVKDIDKAAQACAATSQTTSFALHASNKVLKFDPEGNSKTMTALKNRADRTDPSKPQAAPMTAKVEGSESAGVIQVEKIEVQ